MDSTFPYAVLSHFSHVQLCVTTQTAASEPLCPCNSAGKNMGVDFRALLQKIFPIQGSNVHLLWPLNCQESHMGSPLFPITLGKYG